MTRVLSQPSSRHPLAELDDVQHIVLEDISWSLYERLLKEIGDRHLQVTYDRGRLEVMSPLPEHERPSRLLGRLVQTMTFVLDLPIGSWGSTTFRRKDRGRGLQPDECFFLTNEAKVRGRKRWDPKKDPPPDLVIEADVTNRSIDREPIYASLGVPEIWRWDGKRVQCLHRAGAKYQVAEKSLAFPFLAPADLARFVLMFDRQEENQVVREFTKWLASIGRET